ncbi:MAG: hypothetical protein ABI277_16725 [Burkholderiaceae bacterium]
MKNLLVTMIGVAVAVAGCAADPNNPNSSVAQGTGEGAGVGAVTGVVICALVKCSHDQYLVAAAAGAAVGGTVGYSLAKDVEKRRKALAGKENNLDARLIYVRGLNTDTEKFNQQFKNETVALQQQMDSGKRNGQSLEQQQTQINTQVKNANTQIASLDNALTDMKKYRAQPSTPNSPALDSEIGRLETLLAEAKTNTTSMASLRQRI